MLTKEEAKRIVKEMKPTFLEKAKRSGYICPKCNNGAGRDGTGITLDPHSGRYHCHKCGLHEDVIGLYKIFKNITEDKQVFEELYHYYQLEVEVLKQGQNYDRNGTAIKKYLLACAGRVKDTDYFTTRGLSDETIKKYRLGYDADFRTSNGKWKAAIIPTGGGCYVARNTDKNAADSNRYRNVGESNIYLPCNLYQEAKPIIITEGEIDALSIIEAGGVAVGLGSTSNYKKLLETISKNRKQVKQSFIIALDNDEAGNRTADQLEEGLQELGIVFQRADLYGSDKDANAALLTNKDQLGEAIKGATEGIKLAEAKQEEDARAEYYKNSAAGYIDKFLDEINGIDTPFIPTQFRRLNTLLEGGLYEGLYILGAASSIGKTSFILQLADEIAERGNSVLFFSLEMGRHELMAKSISRWTYKIVTDRKEDRLLAKSTRGITTRRRYELYSDQEKAIINEAIKRYRTYAKDIFIHEGIGEIGVNRVREEIEKHIKYTKQSPVVIIDYVQILSPADVRATDKQNIDKAVLELKRISRDYRIPVIGISSFNRASYNGAAAMEAFKESGALEYGADVLLGLQFQGAGAKEFDYDAAKLEEIRRLELVVLKNRNGASGGKIQFDYYQLFNHFKETGPATINIMS